MNIRYRFPLSQPFALKDAWPLQLEDAIVEFERKDGDAVAILVTFQDQPISSAPLVVQRPTGPISADIKFRDPLSSAAVRIVKRFKTYINLFFIVRFDVSIFGVEFIPANEQERSAIAVFKFDVDRNSPKSDIPFSMIAQAMFAGETADDDPSFASALAQMARESTIEKQYIEAFRYCFFLFEGLYGEGKFKSSQLVQAMSNNASFVAMTEETIRELNTDPLHRGDKARMLVEKHSTALAIIKHLIDRRGFYFHGNTTRHDAWKPDQQDAAEELASFTVLLAYNIAMSLAHSMFSADIGRRYFENAKRMGAIMTIRVQYVFLNDHGKAERGVFNANVPGTIPTNQMAIYVHKVFLEYIETELHWETLIEAIANEPKSERELFRSRYINDNFENGDTTT